MDKLIQFNNKWKNMFAIEQDMILAALGDYKIEKIEHIGATSVVLCGTYGTIDILLSVQDRMNLVVVKNILVGKGYEYVAHLSDDMKDIFMIRKDDKGRIVATIHIVEYASVTYQEYILFKFHLREGNNAIKYNKTREAILEKCDGDHKEYRKQKAEYIRYILANFCKTQER